MRTALLLPCFAMASTLFAQSSGNDTCEEAYPVPVMQGAVPDPWVHCDLGHESSAVALPTCEGTGLYDGWFSFVATTSSHTIVHSWFTGPGFRIEAFSGTCGSLVSLGCSDAQPAKWALKLTGLVPGTTYLFRLYATGMPYRFTDVGVLTGLSNDECASATELIPSQGASAFTPGEQFLTVGATQSLPGCAVAVASDDDVWFRFTAVSTKHIVILRSQNEVVVQAYSGACGALTSLWCEDAWTYDYEMAGLTIGQSVYLRVYSLSTVPQDFVEFRIAIGAPPANDECANATPISVNTEVAPGPVFAVNLTSATASVVNDFPSTRDVWYQFTAPSDAVVFNKQGAVALSLYDAGCMDGIINGPGSSDLTVTGLVAGTSYRLKASGNPNPETAFSTHGITTNDECADALPLTVQSPSDPVNFTYAATHGATGAPSPCAAAVDDDVWFTFTASSARMMLYASPTSLSYELYAGTCGGLVYEECDGISGQEALLDSLVVGGNYALRLWTNLNSVGELLRVRLVTVATNDECVGALPLVPVALADYSPEARTQFKFASSSLPQCGSAMASRDLWYSFTAIGTTAALVVQEVYVPFTLSMELFSGTCGALNSIVCTTDPQYNFTGLTPGGTYYLRLYTSAGVTPSQFTHQFYQPPANDEPAGAVQLMPNGNAFAHPMRPFANYGASMSFPQVACTGTPNADTWFWFVATAAQHTVGVDVGSRQYDETMATFRIETFFGFSTFPDTLLANELACGTSTNGINVTGLAVGDTVMVRLFPSATGPEYIRTFHPWVGDGSDPDDAIGATPIPFYDAYSVAFDTDGATQSLPPNNCVYFGESADDDIWFSFVHDGQPASITCHFLDNNIVTELFSGPVGSLVPIACGNAMLVLPSGLVDGQTYYFRLYSRNTSDLTGMVGLFHTPHPMATACADVDCLGPNLVVNPSIEQGGLCAPEVPDGNSPYDYEITPGWHTAIWTADSYASCADYNDSEHLPYLPGLPSEALASDTRPRNGTGVARILASTGNAGYHEAIGNELSAPLVPGTPYLLAFNVKLQGDQSGLDGLGIHMSMDRISYFSSPVYLPAQVEWQGAPINVTDDWVTICGQIIADQPYRYINISAWKPESEMIGGTATVAYFIDDVTVAEVIDALCVTVDMEEVDPATSSAVAGDGLRVFPNPANDRLNISIEDVMIGEEAVIELFDVTGKQVHARVVSSLASNLVLDLPAELREGSYLVMVRVEGQEPKSARVILHR